MKSKRWINLFASNSSMCWSSLSWSRRWEMLYGFVVAFLCKMHTHTHTLTLFFPCTRYVHRVILDSRKRNEMNTMERKKTNVHHVHYSRFIEHFRFMDVGCHTHTHPHEHVTRHPSCFPCTRTFIKSFRWWFFSFSLFPEVHTHSQKTSPPLIVEWE